MHTLSSHVNTADYMHTFPVEMHRIEAHIDTCILHMDTNGAAELHNICLHQDQQLCTAMPYEELCRLCSNRCRLGMTITDGAA